MNLSGTAPPRFESLTAHQSRALPEQLGVPDFVFSRPPYFLCTHVYLFFPDTSATSHAC